MARSRSLEKPMIRYRQVKRKMTTIPAIRRIMPPNRSSPGVVIVRDSSPSTPCLIILGIVSWRRSTRMSAVNPAARRPRCLRYVGRSSSLSCENGTRFDSVFSAGFDFLVLKGLSVSYVKKICELKDYGQLQIIMTALVNVTQKPARITNYLVY